MSSKLFGMDGGVKIQKLDNGNFVESTVGDSLGDADVLFIYFSAHWCPPCRNFTPILKDAYEEAKNDGAKVEILFVSSDQTPDDMKNYMKNDHGDWFALPHQAELTNVLMKTYGVNGIPMLVAVLKDGSLKDADAKSMVQWKGPEYFKTILLL